MEESFVVCSTSQPEWYFVVCNIFWRQRLGCWDHSFRACFLGATAWSAALLFVFVFVAHLKGNYEAAIFWAVSNTAIFVIMSWNEKSFNFSKLFLIEIPTQSSYWRKDGPLPLTVVDTGIFGVVVHGCALHCSIALGRDLVRHRSPACWPVCFQTHSTLRWRCPTPQRTLHCEGNKELLWFTIWIAYESWNDTICRK